MPVLVTPAFPPSFERAAAVLRALGESHPDIARLEIFGSVARGEATAASDLDVMVSFVPGMRARGFHYFGRIDELEAEMRAAVGVPVDLHDRAGVEHCPNPSRRASMLGGARLVYAA